MSEPYADYDDGRWEDDLERRLDDLEERIAALELETSIDEAMPTSAVVRITTSILIGLMEAVSVKAMSESEESQEEFVNLLRTAIRENIFTTYKVEYRAGAASVLERIAKLVGQPSADRLLKLYSEPSSETSSPKISPPPAPRDDE